MCDPKGCAKVLVVVRGGGPPPPLVDPNLGGRWVGRSAAGLPGGGGGGRSVGTPTYIPQNDPHHTLLILDMHKWGKIFSKKIAHQLTLPSAKVRPGGRVGVKILFCAFPPFLNSPQNSDYFEYRHIGSNTKISPCHMPKAKSPAPLAPTKPIILHNNFAVCRGEGSRPPLGSAPVVAIGPHRPP